MGTGDRSGTDVSERDSAKEQRPRCTQSSHRLFEPIRGDFKSVTFSLSLKTLNNILGKY